MMKATKYLLVCLAMCVGTYAQRLPTIKTLGMQDTRCLDAVYKVAYVETRVGVPTNHTVYVACDSESYKKIVEERGKNLSDVPYAFTDPKTTTTYMWSGSILRADSGTILHDGYRAAYHNFGEYVIAHEIGHLAIGPAEWQADSWGLQSLKKYVKVSYEEFNLTKR